MMVSIVSIMSNKTANMSLSSGSIASGKVSFKSNRLLVGKNVNTGGGEVVGLAEIEGAEDGCSVGMEGAEEGCSVGISEGDSDGRDKGDSVAQHCGCSSGILY